VPGELHGDRTHATAAAETTTVSPGLSATARTAAYAVVKAEQRTRLLPGDTGRARDQLGLLGENVLGVAGPLVGEADHLVAYREAP
jgi:hypothetical protein